MKLWFQSLVHNVETEPFGDMLRDIFAASAGPGTEVHIHGLHKSSGFGVHYRYLEYNDTGEVIANAIRAEKEGYDGFMIGNISDAGIRECREMINIPVVGLCESSLFFACMMGASFGLINISPKWAPRILENVKRYGLESRLAATDALNTSPLELKKAIHDKSLREGILADFMAAARQLLAKGAEVIVPAGGDITVFLRDAGIYQVDGAPIVIGHTALVKMAEAAVGMRKITGVFTSKHLQYAAPTGDFLQRIRKFYGPDVYPGAK